MTETIDDSLLQRLIRDLRQGQAEHGLTLLRTTEAVDRLTTRAGALEVRLNDLREDMRFIVSTEGLRTRNSLEERFDNGLAILRAELAALLKEPRT